MPEPHAETNPFLQFAPPGHFYSPLPDAQALSPHLFDRQVDQIPGIDIRANAQLALLPRLASFVGAMPWRQEPVAGLRYYFGNDFFGHGDATVLYGMLRHYEPRRIVEVGSGFSSAVMLDTADRFMAHAPEITFIEPYETERLLSLEPAATIIRTPVQDVSLQMYDALQANDLLFIDSSHVAKIGSDVLHLWTYVLPRLKPGVLIHIHDIFWPFEYPEEWLREGRAWNEAYLLRAFLQFNRAFEIRFFNSYLAAKHRDHVVDALPPTRYNPGGSFWMQKVE
jgi:predicted O-methyltransferase YrrM